MKFKLKVICCYDSDVFELAQKPPANWTIVKKKVSDLGINEFEEIVSYSNVMHRPKTTENKRFDTKFL